MHFVELDELEDLRRNLVVVKLVCQVFTQVLQGQALLLRGLLTELSHLSEASQVGLSGPRLLDPNVLLCLHDQGLFSGGSVQLSR